MQRPEYPAGNQSPSATLNDAEQGYLQALVKHANDHGQWAGVADRPDGSADTVLNEVTSEGNSWRARAATRAVTELLQSLTRSNDGFSLIYNPILPLGDTITRTHQEGNRLTRTDLQQVLGRLTVRTYRCHGPVKIRTAKYRAWESGSFEGDGQVQDPLHPGQTRHGRVFLPYNAQKLDPSEAEIFERFRRLIPVIQFLYARPTGNGTTN